jgi:hypothetical protein
LVAGDWTDGAYSSLAPFGYWYELMATYNDRADLQAAFPDAYTDFAQYTGLVNWAGAVVTQLRRPHVGSPSPENPGEGRDASSPRSLRGQVLLNLSAGWVLLGFTPGPTRRHERWRMNFW